MEEFRELQSGLEEFCGNSEERAMYCSNLCQFIVKISNYIIKSDAVKRKACEIMGGKVLKLQTEIWLEQGETRGRELERKLLTYEYVSEGDISPEKAAKRLGITVEELRRNMQLEGYSYPEK